jgi:hypothetical protein
MSGYFFDFASQNQKNNHSFIILFRHQRRRNTFETASEEIFGHTAGLWPAVCPSWGQAAPAKQITGSFEITFIHYFFGGASRQGSFATASRIFHDRESARKECCETASPFPEMCRQKQRLLFQGASRISSICQRKAGISFFSILPCKNEKNGIHLLLVN